MPRLLFAGFSRQKAGSRRCRPGEALLLQNGGRYAAVRWRFPLTHAQCDERRSPYARAKPRDSRGTVQFQEFLCDDDARIVLSIAVRCTAHHLYRCIHACRRLRLVLCHHRWYSGHDVELRCVQRNRQPGLRRRTRSRWRPHEQRHENLSFGGAYMIEKSESVVWGGTLCIVPLGRAMMNQR